MFEINCKALTGSLTITQSSNYPKTCRMCYSPVSMSCALLSVSATVPFGQTSSHHSTVTEPVETR